MYLEFTYKGKKYEYRDFFLSKGLFVLDKENKTYVEVENITKALQAQIDKELLSFNNRQRKIQIFGELSDLDMKMLRPLAENETDRLQEIISKKEILRQELRSLNE